MITENLSTLKIHKFKTEAQYEKALESGQINDTDICLAPDDNTEINLHISNNVAHITATERASWNAKSNFSGDYADLTGKPTIPTVPTKVSAFTNDAGYLTRHQDISGKADKTDIVYVTPQMFGAKADGVTDDTKAINDAIEATGNNGVVFFPEGKYSVSSSMSSSLGEAERYMAIKIYEKENITLQLSPKAHIKHKPFTEDEIKSAGMTRHYIIGIVRSTNVQIIGGKIEGEADTHTYHLYQDDGTYSRTHGYGINIYSSNDVTIKDCEVFNCYGDGVHVSIASGSSKSNNAVIENCKIHDCIRLGLGICGADNTLIKDCEIYDIVGASPQSGIDFEPDYVSNMNINSVVENCHIHDCAAYAIINAKANQGVKIRDCRLYGRVTSTCDDTHPIEYINCDMLWYQSSNAYRNILHNCRIASVGMYEAGDDFYNCIFNPDLFNHIVEGYGSTVSSLIESGSAVTATSFARFYNCEFITTNSGGYASNFMTWRNNGKMKSVVFDGCTFSFGLHSYQGMSINVLNDIEITGCIFNTQETAWPKQFIELRASNHLYFKNNVIDIRTFTSYSGYSSIVRLYTKDTYLEGNIFLGNKKVGTYPFAQTFDGTAGELYVLRNYMPLWDTFGSFTSSTATRFISAGNIVSTSESEAVFTEEDKEKLDGINDIISNSGFITEEDSKSYTDSKVMEIAAQASQQAPLFATTIDECVDTTKVYVLPDGNIYGYVSTRTEGGEKLFKDWLPLGIDSDGSIFNGIGYKVGWRVNTSGALQEDTSGCVVTGFIPCKSGDIIRISGMTFNVNNNYAISYKSDFTKYGNPIYRTAFKDEGNGLYSIDTSSFPTTTAYVRISVGSFSADAVIAINEEIVYSEPTTTYKWTDTGHPFIAIMEDGAVVNVATQTDISEHNSSLNAHSDIRAMFDDLPDVLQTTGSSTSNTMSQKAITDALSNATVSDAQVASAVADYIAKNPISGSGGADVTEGTFFIQGSGTTDSSSKTSTWTGTSNRITEYYDGLAIRYKIGVAGQSTTTLNINGLGAKPVYLFNTTKLTTQFPVNSIINLIYHTDLNSGCWMCSDYDSNTNTYQRVYPTTTSAEYPITTRYNTTTGSSYYAEYGRYSTGVTLNPSTNTITATTFKGALSGNAATATKATQDSSGNTITSTYAKKADAETWTFTLKDGSTVTKKVVLG